MNLFILAMKEEITFEFEKKEIIDNFEYFFLNSNNILVFSDVGLINASMTLTHALKTFPNIENIFNLGSCGSCNKLTKPNELFLIKSVQFLDVDLTGFNYELNAFPRNPKHFLLEPSLINETIKQEFDFKLGTCASCNSFVNKTNFHNFKEATAINVIDMELAGLAFVARKFNKKLISFKYVTDSVSFPLENEKQFNENLKVAQKTLSKILKKIII